VGLAAHKERVSIVNLSIAIPCYNGAAYIGRVIETALKQTHSADEIIVVDDGSIDNSAQIVQAYPVTLIQHASNEGLAAARNTALNAVNSEIILFVDADALAAPDLVETVLKGYDAGDVCLAGVGGQGIEANIQSLADRWRRAHASQGHGPVRKYVPYLFGLCMSYRVSKLRAIGGFRLDFRTNAEDMDAGLRLNAAGFRLLYLPEAHVYHQRTDDVASLKRMMAAWYSAAYRAKRRNNVHPWTLFAGTLRRMIADPITDVIVKRDPALAGLDFRLCGVKFKALWQAAQTREITP
jgi:glycosyltransferase involved in cell wall biosynthesis